MEFSVLIPLSALGLAIIFIVYLIRSRPANFQGDQVLEALNSSLKETIRTLTDEKNNLQQKVSKLEKENASLEAQHESSQKYFEEQKLEFEKSRDKLNEEFEKSQEALKAVFENTANKIFETKTDTFRKRSQEDIGTLLSPFQKQLDVLKKEIEEKYQNESKERYALQGEVKSLLELNQTLSTEAHNLTMALKGGKKNKVAGNWGEMQCETILESSGLVKGKHYIPQAKGMGLKNKAGNPEQVDFVIVLPEEKHLTLDSKVSLKAYTEIYETESPEEQEAAKNRLFNSIKNHIDSLAAKKYYQNDKLFTLEFTLMFLPLEFALSIVIDKEVPHVCVDLFSYAWSKGVIIVTPSTLLATLRTIESIWRYDRQEKNAQKIAEQGGKLFDMFCDFIKDMKNIEAHLNKATDAYDSAFKRLTTGRGNLLRQTEQIKILGAKTKKELPRDMIE